MSMRIARFEWRRVALLALLLLLLPSLAFASSSGTNAAHRYAKSVHIVALSHFESDPVNLLHQQKPRLAVYDQIFRVKPEPAHHVQQMHHLSGRLAYRVKPGDTLWQLATQHNLTVTQLQMENQLTSTVIYPGQKLVIESARAYFAAVRTAYLHSGVARAIRAGVPSSLVPVYEAAGQAYHIPWTVLAAIHRVETDFARQGPIVSAAGAQGPMQFMPQTFAEYGVTAPGQAGPPNINNVYDAIFSTAHMLSVDGYNHDPAKAIFLYNHSQSYVRDVQSTARSY